MAKRKKPAPKPQTVKVQSITFAGRSVSLPNPSEDGAGAIKFGDDTFAEVNPRQAARLVELFPNDVRVV